MTEADVRFVVPGNPKALKRNEHRTVDKKDGSSFVVSYLPTKSRSEQSVIRLFASEAMDGMAPLKGPLDMRITAFMPIRQSWSKKKQRDALAGIIMPTHTPDSSNILKNVEDAIQGVCYANDSQIVACHVWKHYSDTPRVVVEIRSVNKITNTAPI